ncbi:MAG: hypothetical protein KDA93_25525 [Planctomycetaceae bacterium]|nr:hypothetical protein [Planctomycetaceae bacterium]
MIVKQNVPWLKMLFSVSGSSLRFTWRRIIFMTIFSVIVTWVELRYDLEHFSLTAEPFTMIGLALGIFLGFRNNAAYDRFWEGRKLWGRLVNTSRSFTRQVLTLIGPQAGTLPDGLREFQEDLVYRMIAYVYALKHHLRKTSPFEELRQYLSAEEVAKLEQHQNVPIALLQDMGEHVRQAWDQGWITEYHLPIIEESLTTLTDIQGGCERIKNTPIPYAYTVLIHRLVAFYCFFLPFGIVKTVGPLTPVVVLLISHAFIGLDDIGDEIEDPFDTDPQALPLAALCRTIEINLLQAIDVEDLPEMLEPERSILL